jgi:dienelactone hydrolase
MRLASIPIVISTFMLIAISVNAEQITYSATTSPKTTQARLERPKNMPSTGGAAAVVLLHHGGGCSNTQTRKYADALNEIGYFTLEPCLFNDASGQQQSTVVFLPQVFGALKYLAELPGVDKNKIAVMGGSYGAALAFVSATTWAYTTHADGNFPPFAAHAPFYPGCSIYERFIKAKVGRADLPGDAYEKFTGAPVRIYSGGKDDYDSRDPKACESMIRSLAPKNQELVSLKFFPNATHGWDHIVSANFYDHRACKGRGCMNTNIVDAEITKEGITDLIEFFRKSMPAK